MAFYLVNERRGDDGHYAETEYDFGGETRILAPNSRTLVSSHAEAQLAVSKFQTVGVSLQEAENLQTGSLDVQAPSVADEVLLPDPKKAKKK